PIQARPAGLLERGWKWVRRRPAAAGLIAASLVAVATTVTAVVLHQLERLHEQERRYALLLEVEPLVDQAEHAILKGDWDGAKEASTSAIDKIGTEPSLRDHRDRAISAQVKAKGALEAKERSRRAKATFDTFRTLRDKARFHETLMTGLDPAAN